jgi:hypothetical protein
MRSPRSARSPKDRLALRARRELPAVRYTDRNGRPKHVRYWFMTPERFEHFTPNAEIDEVRRISTVH